MSVLWTGCDDLLDVTPQTDITDANYWTSETNLKAACNRMYEQLDAATFDARADEWVGSGGTSTIASGERIIPVTSDDWTLPYRRIFTANNIIMKAADAPINETVRNKYLAEAYFFRAYYYFALVCKYGDVPLLLKVISGPTDPAAKMGRTPRETVIQQCYDDLEYAAKWLPKRADLQGSNDEFARRRVTRSAALALTVRIGLYEGTMQKYHSLGAEAQWKAHLQKSISAYTLLKAEGHALYDGTNGYQALFIDESNSTNREVIFAKAYGPNGGSGTGYTNHSYTSGGASYGLTRAMIDTYLYANGLPRNKQTLAPETAFNHALGYESDGVTPLTGYERDPRLPMTVWRVNDPQDAANATVAGALIAFRLGEAQGYFPYTSTANGRRAYTLKKAFVGSRWGNNSDYTDRVIIRWGEMLVSYAEALYELNGSITDAQLNETVNALRTRVGFDAALSNAFAASNGLDMKTEIRRERTVELMGEGRRFDDIIRWKIAETVLRKATMGSKFAPGDSPEGNTLAVDATFLARLTDATGKVNGVQEYDYPEAGIYLMDASANRQFRADRDYYYPIPSFEIAQSEGNIKQNPKW